MGQKIHPLGLRLNITQRHRSNWCFDTNEYPRLILEDKAIRDYLFKTYPKAEISEIFIARLDLVHNIIRDVYVDTVLVKIYSPRCGRIVVGKKAQRRRTLRALAKKLEGLEKNRQKRGLYELRIQVDVRRVEIRDTQASSIAYKLIEKLEDRQPFRPALKKALREAIAHPLNGLRIQISGRLNGAEIARTEWVRHGRVPLHTVTANIDYCYKTASTMYGILGIRVWTFKPVQIWNYSKNDIHARRLQNLARKDLIQFKRSHKLDYWRQQRLLQRKALRDQGLTEKNS